VSSPRLEGFLARLYTDQALLEAFLRQPKAVAREAGLTDSDAAALTTIDRDGLVMAARSFRAKRQTAAGRRRWFWLRRR
jgi:hypothetical protein